ncbi:SP_0009 family protein [Streptococcus oricebi]|nr:SP_0009 family protein [Streptococcus oricebi]
MENLIETVAEFLEFSDEKLAQLSEKNQALKLQKNQKERKEDA